MLTDIDMILGDFEFRIQTAAFQSLERRHRQNKATLQRIGRKAASQHIGAELGTIALTGHILPLWHGGWEQMDRLRAMADTGNPFTLMDGLGKNWGQWEIVEVGERATEYLNGAPTRIEFDISLSEYGPDQSGIDVLSFAINALTRLV